MVEGVSQRSIYSKCSALEDILRSGVSLVEETVADDNDIHCLAFTFTINIYFVNVIEKNIKIPT